MKGSTNSLLQARNAPLAQAMRRADQFKSKQYAPQTTIRYAELFARFERFCAAQKLQALPASTKTVLTYLGYLSDNLRAGTVRIYMNGISARHRSAGLPDPTRSEHVLNMVKGLQLGQPKRRRAALRRQELTKLLSHLSDEPADIRDRAFLLLIYACGLPAREIHGMRCEDIETVDGGLVVGFHDGRLACFVGKAATEQFCPVTALNAWLQLLGRKTGFVFVGRSTRGRWRETPLSTVNGRSILLRLCRLAGIRPAAYSLLSIRKGFMLDACDVLQPSIIMKHLDIRRLSTLEDNIGKALMPRTHASKQRRTQRYKDRSE